MPNSVQSYWELIEPSLSTINIYDGPAAFEASIAGVPRPGVFLYAAHWCQSEVCNGGFLQLFMNSTGVLVPEAIEGFNAIGMPFLASIVASASDPLGSPYPRNRNDRRDSLLVASGRTTGELEKIFKTASDTKDHRSLYKAFHVATENMHFKTLEKQFYENIKSESGGFQVAATRYAQSLQLTQ